MKVKTRIINKEIETESLKYAKEGDAGIDLTATSKWYDEHGNICFGTNRAFEIPKGYVGLLFPRSSNAKMDLLLSNSVGVIDSGYRGEVMMKFKSIYDKGKNHKVLCKILESYCGVELNGEIKAKDLIPQEYEIGDRIGQLIILPYPEIEFEEVDELSDSERGSGGYGSTGK